MECASKVRIASAWMTGSDALQALLKRKRSDCTVRAIIGIRGNATSPDSLELLAGHFGWDSLKLADPSGLFHPKLYLFSYSGKPTVAWIGSANFTRNGMAANTELVIEIDDDSAVAAMVDWFCKQWVELRQNAEEKFEAYKADWREPDRYVGDLGGFGLGVTIRIRPTRKLRQRRENLTGEIICGPGDHKPYESAADGLRQLLVRLSHTRENEFFQACRQKAAFQRQTDDGRKYYIVERRTKDAAVSSGELYDPSKGGTRLVTLGANGSKWWMSGNSNNDAKWNMAKAAVDVANSEFGDQVVLEDDGTGSWPDRRKERT